MNVIASLCFALAAVALWVVALSSVTGLRAVWNFLMALFCMIVAWGLMASWLRQRKTIISASIARQTAEKRSEELQARRDAREALGRAFRDGAFRDAHERRSGRDRRSRPAPDPDDDWPSTKIGW